MKTLKQNIPSFKAEVMKFVTCIRFCSVDLHGKKPYWCSYNRLFARSIVNRRHGVGYKIPPWGKGLTIDRAKDDCREQSLPAGVVWGKKCVWSCVCKWRGAPCTQSSFIVMAPGPRHTAGPTETPPPHTQADLGVGGHVRERELGPRNHVTCYFIAQPCHATLSGRRVGRPTAS